jgi:arylsulfatase A-like enzyme
MLHTRASTVAALGLLIAGCGTDAAPAPSTTRAPDIVLVVVDTLRADRLSCYGYPRPTSPFIDQLAREGALFEDASAQYAWTVPSMVSMFSGRYVTDRREILVDDVPCLAQTLRDAGYRTFAEVANQLIDEKGGLARGFEHFSSAPNTRERPTGDPENSRNITDLAAALERPLEAALAGEPTEERAPFFVYLHALEPHHPYKRRPRLDLVLPPNEAVPVWPDAWQASVLEEAGRRYSATDDLDVKMRGIHAERGRYDQEVRFTDDQLRRIFERLEGFGLLEHAVVAVVADHGEGLWDHEFPERRETQHLRPGEVFYGEHGDLLHQEAIATPFILSGTGIPAGLRVPTPVENVDLFPTLLELAGIRAPDGLHGRSLVGHLKGRPMEPGLLVAYAAALTVAVREPATGLKLTLSQDERNGEVAAVSLFDLRADPAERMDLVGEKPEDVARITRAFLEWRAVHGSWGVAEDLIRKDADQLERMRQLGYLDSGVGAGRDD